ncbi:helix-turn-helix domain-containing protein [Micromonospora pisi]|uniref:helix-turn-helix domain-containing protein n=1 Tax=Micromonospora pisi TaxID=589240 RepID=UPI001FEB6304|nr:helix-turn-helix domain-containing protein [Micromonospora pisi]
MAIDKAKGKLKGRAPKLSAPRQAHLLELHAAGAHTFAELAELFEVSRPTVYRGAGTRRRDREHPRVTDLSIDAAGITHVLDPRRPVRRGQTRHDQPTRIECRPVHRRQCPHPGHSQGTGDPCPAMARVRAA